MKRSGRSVSGRIALLSIALVAAASYSFAQDDETTPVNQCVVNPDTPFGSSSDLARVFRLETNLSTLGENPAILDRSASGSAEIIIRFDRLGSNDTMPQSASIMANLKSTVAQEETINDAHIHMGAVGTNGPVVIPLSPQDDFTIGAGESQTFTISSSFSDPQTIEELLDIVANPGDYYVNIHSNSNSPGLIRGQLMLESGGQTACLANQVSSIQGKLDTIISMLEDLGLDGNDDMDVSSVGERVRLLLRFATIEAAQQSIISANERDDLLEDLDAPEAQE